MGLVMNTLLTTEKPNIVIIGGGAGGSGTAVTLADAGYKVTLIERNNELLSATSNATPCRLGLGFHYMDRDTAFGYLEASINFVKKYPGYKLGESIGLPENAPLRRGRYFITKDSIYSPPEILNLFKDLQARYEQLVQTDPSNKVFGEPKDFFQILHPSEYENDINMSKVELGIETAEHLLNWPQLKQDLIARIHSHPNITVLTEHEVTNLGYSTEGLGYTVTCRDNKKNEIKLSAPYLLNAAWQNIEMLNAKGGFHNPVDERVNRLKVMIQVQLPKELEKKNSMFFCFGAHCSFSNRGDGTGFITYEPVTNIDQSTELSPPEMFERLTKQLATTEEQRSYSEKIIAGVAQYIPEMKNAEFKSIRFGIVKTKGKKIDIYSKNSEHHKRSDTGIAERNLGLIENGCMKLLYLQKNSVMAKELFEKHMKIDLAIQETIINSYELCKNALTLNKDAIINTHLIKHTFNDYCRRYSVLRDENFSREHAQQITKTASLKFFLNTEIKTSKSTEKPDIITTTVQSPTHRA